MPEQLRTNAAALRGAHDVCMPYEVDVANPLPAHHADQPPVRFAAPEFDAGMNIRLQLGPRHIGLMPAFRRYGAAVHQSCVIDDVCDSLVVAFAATSDLVHMRSIVIGSVILAASGDSILAKNCARPPKTG